MQGNNSTKVADVCRTQRLGAMIGNKDPIIRCIECNCWLKEMKKDTGELFFSHRHTNTLGYCKVHGCCNPKVDGDKDLNIWEFEDVKK